MKTCLRPLYLLSSDLRRFIFQLLEFRSCLLQAGFSGVEDRAEMIRVVICSVLITCMNSLDSWGFAQIPGKVVTLYFLFTYNGDNRWQNSFSYFTKLSWILIFPFGFLIVFWVSCNSVFFVPFFPKNDQMPEVTWYKNNLLVKINYLLVK